MIALFSTVLTSAGLGLVIGVNPPAAMCTVQIFGSGDLLQLPVTAVQVVVIA